MKVEKLNKLVTGNWYVRNDLLYIEYRRYSEGAFGMPFTTFKYISEEKIDG